ncbi:sigma 54-interacting transcriptional regulator [Vulgatibacter sp.]|uniref:sigma 54-interacting transcriptional regulator n=1 Tax=Vulgatibacter sp. TaxID=1971226 RepID=UPI0035691D04
MPSLTLRLPDGTTRTVQLIKRITTVGRSADNDVVIADPSVPASALHLQMAGDACNVVALDADFFFNGRKKNEAVLRSGDVLGVGGAELLLEDEAAAQLAPAKGFSAEALAAFRQIHAFSERLLGDYEIEQVLENLMDAAIEVVNADKGFLILFEGSELRVKVARNLGKQNIEDAIERVSDSIVAKVVKSRRPLIVSDALHDAEFNSAASVVNLKLCSVMCAPLMEKGNLFGLIYVGNDSVVNLFEEHSLDLLTIFAAQASLLLRNALLVNELKLDNRELRKALDDSRYGEILGACAAMRDVYRKIDKIAGTDISVLVTGETGTGKEMLAREIHRRSTRKNGPFVAINCGAIPENLLESELFGHVKGAFTGAVASRVGRFQAANGGTLFLDEIGEMPVHLQVKILRALQERTVTRVGDNRAEPVDIRVVAATNKNLEEEIKRGNFREDLYYRLNVVNLHLPPLRERGEDVVVLARFFLSLFSREFGAKTRGFTPNATIAMKKYAWPGNVRELENRVKKAVVLADRALVSADDLELRPENLDPIMPLQQAKEEFQKRYINEVLERNGGNRTKTARDLGVDPRTIFRHLESERQGDEDGDDR